MKSMRKALALLMMAVMLLSMLPTALANEAEMPCPDSRDGKHDWKLVESMKGDCVEPGQDLYECRNCGAHRYEWVYGEHDWGKWQTTKEATCTSTGTRERTCKSCGRTQTDTIEKADHDWGKWKTVKEATCTSTGSRTRTCKNCGREQTQETDRKPHEYGEWTIIEAATDHSKGTRSGVCVNCGYERTEEYYPEGTLMRGWDNDQDAVKALQQALNDAGFDSGKADGIFGKKTESAVSAFQSSKGFESDGIGWPQTINALISGGKSLRWLPPKDHPDEWTPPVVIFEDGDSGLSLSKYPVNPPANGVYYAAGEEIEYQIMLENCSPYAYPGELEVIDPMKGSNEDMVLDIITDGLAPEEDRTYTFKHTVTSEEADKGLLVNTAYASWWNPETERNEAVAATCPVRVGVMPIYQDMEITPELIVTKEVISKPENGECFHYGDDITYRWHAELTNGKTAKELIVLDSAFVDPLEYHVGEYEYGDWIIPDYEGAGSYTLTVVPELVVGGNLVNTLYVWCRDEDGNTYENWDMAQVKVQNDNGGLIVTKEATNEPANGEYYQVNEEVHYEITITNTDKYYMYDLEITDELTGLSETASVLRDGESLHYTTEYLISYEDAELCEVTNVVNVDYTYEGEAQTASGKCTVPTAPGGKGPDETDGGYNLVLNKIVTGVPANGMYYTVGETVHYRVSVTNLSDDIDRIAMITDPLIGDEIKEDGYQLKGPNGEPIALLQIDGLKHNQTYETDYEYVVTEEDVAAGRIINTATLLVVDDDSNILYEDSTLLEVPTGGAAIADPTSHSLKFQKVVFGFPKNDEYYVEGETIRFKLYAINPGDESFDYTIELTDPLYDPELDGDNGLGHDGNPLVLTIGGLDAHEIYQTLDIHYVVTAEDVEKGYITNTAYMNVIVDDMIVDTYSASDSALTSLAIGGGGDETELDPETIEGDDMWPPVVIVKLECSAPLNGMYYTEGENIIYMIRVENLSDEDFGYMLHVTDPMAELTFDENNFPSIGADGNTLLKKYDGMAAHDYDDLSYSYTVVAEDVQRGYIQNTARLLIIEDNAIIDSDESTVIVSTGGKNGEVTGPIEVVKTADPPANGSYYEENETIQYHIYVHNISDAPLGEGTEIIVTDPLYWPKVGLPIWGYDDNPIVGVFTGAWAVDEWRVFDYEYTVSSDDALEGTLANTAYALLTVNADTICRREDTLIVSTGFKPVGQWDDPTIKITKTRLNAPGNGEFFVQGEEIKYRIEVTATERFYYLDYVADTLWDNVVFADYNVEPGKPYVYEYTHKVTEMDALMGHVYNTASACIKFDKNDQQWFTIFSDEVEAPTGIYGEENGGDPTPAPTTKPQPSPRPDDVPKLPVKDGDSCTRTLIAANGTQERYELHYCAEHAETQKAVDELLANAKTDEERESAWQTARALWTVQLNKLYNEWISSVNGDAKLVVTQEHSKFFEQLEAYEQSLTLLMAEMPERIEREQILAEMVMNRCVDLCYELHTAPDARLDSIEHEHAEIADGEVEPDLTCDHVVEQVLENGNVIYIANPCFDHTATAKQVSDLVSAAHSDDEKTDAWRFAQLYWKNALDAMYNAWYLASADYAQIKIAADRIAFNEYLTAREAGLKLIYPDRPLIVTEQMANIVRDRTLDACNVLNRITKLD